MTTIYHNPRCQKSRETLALLEEKNEDIKIVEYLKDTPTVKELTRILSLLGIGAAEIIRKSEPLYKENYKGKVLSNEEWIKVLVENPILIERPIVVKGNKAALGRPPGTVLDIL